METPSSTRRLTRSQAFSTINISDSSDDSKIPFSSNQTEDSGICLRNNKKAQEDRSALIDITNDSPIVGLAMQTPPSGFMCKRRNSRIKNTSGSGEALLRGQVKTLLHKVEEEGTELTHSIKSLPFVHLLAPTPASTPQFPNFSDDQVLIKIASPVVAGHLRTSQVSYVNGILEVKEEKSMSITRSLLLDFTDKSESLEEEEEEEVDQLCEVMKKMSVETTKAEFAGKHSRFVYNSEDEEIVQAKQVLHLKGIPTPRGKYLRFDN